MIYCDVFYIRIYEKQAWLYLGFEINYAAAAAARSTPKEENVVLYISAFK